MNSQRTLAVFTPEVFGQVRKNDIYTFFQNIGLNVVASVLISVEVLHSLHNVEGEKTIAPQGNVFVFLLEGNDAINKFSGVTRLDKFVDDNFWDYFKIETSLRALNLIFGSSSKIEFDTQCKTLKIFA
jgi:hypothetical protein